MMQKILVIVLVGILIGLVAWDLSKRASVPETRIDSGDFKRVECPSCERMFYVERAHRRGWCPYDGIQFDFSSDE